MMYVIEASYANTSSSLFISRWANYIEELLVTPLSYFEMVAAILIGGLARSLVIAAGVYFVSLTFSSLGMIVGLLAEEFEHLSMATTFVITPLIFFGGVFHSFSMVPEPLRWITVFNPLFYMINGMRYGK